jgi:hypothetical protein
VVAVKMGLAPQILTRRTTQHNFKNELIMEALSEQKYTPYLISVNIYITIDLSVSFQSMRTISTCLFQ